MINLAVVGCGYWGPNLIRNFAQISDVYLSMVCDLDPGRLTRIQKQYPGIKVTTTFSDLLEEPSIEAIAIATPATTHFSLVKDALTSGKHVLVEKPFTLTSRDARELIPLADKKQRTLMVGHLMVYHPAVQKLKQFIQAGELGEIYYIYSTQVNLGQVRQDENVLWSLGPHDVSIALYLLEAEPKEVMAYGVSYLQPPIEDVVFLFLQFPDKKLVQIHLSWLDPHKIRKLTVIGSKKMAVLDDMEPQEKLKFYDKGVVFNKPFSSALDSISLRFGDIYIPKVDGTEPLQVECQHFIDCIKTKKKPLTDGYSALKVVQILEAAEKSMKLKGQMVSIREAI